jgi:hypothetical protein
MNNNNNNNNNNHGNTTENNSGFSTTKFNPQNPEFNPDPNINISQVKNDVKVIVGNETLIIPKHLVKYFVTVLTIVIDTEDEDYLIENGIHLAGVDDPNIVRFAIKFYEKFGKESEKIPVPKDWHCSPRRDMFENEFGHENVEMFMNVIFASNYMHCDALLNNSAKMVAPFIQGQSEEMIRKYFKITKQFTEDQKEQARKEAGKLLE